MLPLLLSAPHIVEQWRGFQKKGLQEMPITTRLVQCNHRQQRKGIGNKSRDYYQCNVDRVDSACFDISRAIRNAMSSFLASCCKSLEILLSINFFQSFKSKLLVKTYILSVLCQAFNFGWHCMKNCRIKHSSKTEVKFLLQLYFMFRLVYLTFNALVCFYHD